MLLYVLVPHYNSRRSSINQYLLHYTLSHHIFERITKEGIVTSAFKYILTMKSVWVLILILGCIASCEVNAYPQGGSRCDTPGQSFYDGCNTCGCSEEGYVTFCTELACIENFPKSGPLNQS
ncbi:hypothetical protein Trydic_g13907 [Trypoxylus dichotomus]